MKVLIVDCALAGLSGDMFISALLDLLGDYNLEPFTQILNTVCKSNVEIEVTSNQLFIKNEIKLTSDEIKTAVLQVLKQLNLQIDLGKNMVETLLKAERIVHGEDDVHLHELGSIDTVIDICLCLLLLEKLKIRHINLSPLATGRGVINISHGIIHVPGPAVTEIVKIFNIPVTDGPVGEATTPTGAMLYGCLSEFYTPAISYTVEKIGFGKGRRTWEDRENILRVRLGSTSNTASSISVLETNLDDVTGEIMGGLVEELVKNGALDVSYSPIIMKKNRPAYCLRVIVQRYDVDRIGELIMQLTGTLGIRVFDIHRHIGNRQIIEKVKKIDGKMYSYNIKQSRYRRKVEYNDLIRIQKVTGMSIFELEHKLLEEE